MESSGDNGHRLPCAKNVSMPNAAVWTDIDNDGKPDLILAGDWMPIRIFHNTATP